MPDTADAALRTAHAGHAVPGSTRSGPRYDPVRRRAATLKRYGLTPPDYARLLLAQHGACAICGRPPSGRRMLDVDHCHLTGEIRGLLCHRCNRGLGYFGIMAAFNIHPYLAGQGDDVQHRLYTGYFVPKKKKRRRGDGGGGG